jgi:hypothetical protein
MAGGFRSDSMKASIDTGPTAGVDREGQACGFLFDSQRSDQESQSEQDHQ